MDILILIFGIVGFVFAIIIHEVSHGLVAERLGDPTARLMGRLTLNPIPHIDVIGSIFVPLALFLLRSPFIFGWAKPVPVDPYNLKNPKKDMAIISLAGPVSNLIFAVILSMSLRILLLIFPNTSLFTLFFYLITFNVVLALFNLMPIGPLDGAKVLTGFLSEKNAALYTRFMDRYGFLLILVFIFPIFNGSSILNIVISPIMSFFLKLLIPGYSLI